MNTQRRSESGETVQEKGAKTRAKPAHVYIVAALVALFGIVIGSIVAEVHGSGADAGAKLPEAFTVFLESSGVEELESLAQALEKEIDRPTYDNDLYGKIVEDLDGGGDRRLQGHLDKLFGLIVDNTDGYPEKRALYEKRLERLGGKTEELVARVEYGLASMVYSETRDEGILHQVFEKYRESSDPQARLSAAEALSCVSAYDYWPEKKREHGTRSAWSSGLERRGPFTE